MHRRANKALQVYRARLQMGVGTTSRTGRLWVISTSRPHLWHWVLSLPNGAVQSMASMVCLLGTRGNLLTDTELQLFPLS